MSVVPPARNLPYWPLDNMKQSLGAGHKLFSKQQPIWDELYMLKIMTYGDLQKGYAKDG